MCLNIYNIYNYINDFSKINNDPKEATEDQLFEMSKILKSSEYAEL